MSPPDLDCVVGYDAVDGPPIYAVLLPAAPFGARWLLADREGRPSLRPSVADIVASPVILAPPVSTFPFPQVRVTIAWPQGVRNALLLLLHPQVDSLDARVLEEQRVTLHESRRPMPKAAHGQPEQVDAVRTAIQKCLIELPGSDLQRGVFRNGRQAGAHGSQRRDSSHAQMPPAFALASCQYPAGMLDGSIQSQPQGLEGEDVGPADRSLWRLSSRVEADDSLAFSVFTGDQVYVDATAGLFDAMTLLDASRFAYERMHGNAGLQRLLRMGCEVYTVLDDHEIVDNWEPMPRPSPADALENLLTAAKTYYLEQQRSMWPGPPPPADGSLYASASPHGLDFFFADVRTEREGRWVANFDTARIMSKEQRVALRTWLDDRAAAQRSDAKVPPCFIVSSSIVFPRLLFLKDRPALSLHADSWWGYPRSTQDLLVDLLDSGISNVVFLSGDEHISCTATVTLTCTSTNRSLTFYSVHSSALYSPYPFANSIPDDFARDDEFEFVKAAENGVDRRITCTVSTFFPGTGDGFALLRPGFDGTSGRWVVDVEFSGESRAANQRLVMPR